MALLVAPYNDSMKMGQGFNSFLQVPCVDNAVEVPLSALRTQAARAGGAQNVSQVVSYSSKFVEKISDVVRDMKISAGSSIKSGTIEVAGSSSGVDEAKFAASDLNAVVSVKVINQTTQLEGEAAFKPLRDMEWSNDKFFDIYGDCYISGFMEGGELHGIVSIKVLDVQKRSAIESTLKGQLNGAAGEFSLSEGAGSSEVSAALSQTETTITVNYAGGGQIKSESEEWSLDSLFSAAAGFPARVASCPQRTWAILTKYDNNRSFLEWAEKHNITVPQFANCQQYTADLLDMFMDYKDNLARIGAVLANPTAYTLAPVSNPVNISIPALVDERKEIKAEMRLISGEIDRLNSNPARLPKIEAESKIRSPEIWATRLPILKAESVDTNFSPMKVAEVLSGFSFATPPSTATASVASKPDTTALDQAVKSAVSASQQTTLQMSKNQALFGTPPPAPLCTPEIEASLTDDMKEFVTSDANKKIYSSFRFGRYVGSNGGGVYNDAVTLQNAMVPVHWPRRIEMATIWWQDHEIVRFIQVTYDQTQSSHGSQGTSQSTAALDLAPDERIVKIKMVKGNNAWGLDGVAYLQMDTSNGQSIKIGAENGNEMIEQEPYDGCVGLKGFFGGNGDVIDRIGPIWST